MQVSLKTVLEVLALLHLSINKQYRVSHKCDLVVGCYETVSPGQITCCVSALILGLSVMNILV